MDIVQYTYGTGDWKTGLAWVDVQKSPVNGRTGAIEIKITSVRQGDSTPSYEYKSAYKVQVSLNNGGQDWSVGDTVITVTQAGKDIHRQG